MGGHRLECQIALVVRESWWDGKKKGCQTDVHEEITPLSENDVSKNKCFGQCVNDLRGLLKFNFFLSSDFFFI